ncbi:MAG: cytochrome c biogenesis protein CcdA [Chitinophagaceae bacterium]
MIKRKNFFYRPILLVLGIILSCSLVAQEAQPVQFSFETKRVNDQEVELKIHAVMQPDVKLYSVQKEKDSVLFSSVSFDDAVQSLLDGSMTEQGDLQTAQDSLLSASVSYYVDSVVWTQKLKIPAGDSVLLKGTVDAMYSKNGEYLPVQKSFREFVHKATVKETTPTNSVANKSLWWIFLAAFGGGLLALLTPCVYSMIPVTVSFFTKRSKTRAEGIRNAIYYALSIIVIFTLLGFAITLIFGPAALNNLATNWIANLIFFALFIIFGISFLGAFEITLPSSWTNKSDAKAGTGSFLGIFFMALTLVLVSFSCTGPIIGNLLVLAAKGNYWGPLTGMFGFSAALALPFAFFAFFPSKLNILGKAGGWLNAIKVTLGFLELALALKFLSNADLVKGWRILDREVFISLWVVIFILLGVYLLGKIKFRHDDELPKNDFGLPYLSVKRLMFAILSFSFALYMIPGLWGAPLKAISAFVPPMGTQDFIVTGSRNQIAMSSGGSHEDALPPPVKYYDRMKIYEPEVVTTYGMVTYFDYDEALAVARKLKRPLMLDFTGINCVNCRKMEGQVWSNPEIMQRLKNNFVIVSLYVDVQSIDLQENEIYYSKALGKKITTLGDKNADLQVTKYGANSQPYYFFLDAHEKRLIPEGYGYDPNIEHFKNLLDEAVANYKKSQGS